MDNNFLVSVCVITYNSSKYVLETLESIYKQTYTNIELVISDDGSKDDTVELISEWINDHQSRFISTTVLTVEKNTGTSANCNRGLKVCKGEWIKFIAGDDVLLENSVLNIVNYVAKNPEAKWIYAKAILYNMQILKECVMTEDEGYYDRCKIFCSWGWQRQFYRMCLTNTLFHPTHFLKKELLRQIGGFDEEFGILEDYPLWLKIYINGEKCFFCDEYVVGYRLGDTNAVNNRAFLLNRKIYKLQYQAKKKLVFRFVPVFIRIYAVLRYSLVLLFSLPLLNRRTSVRKAIFDILAGTMTKIATKIVLWKY